MTSNNTPLILASSSPYRRQLLERLKLAFTCESPDINEDQVPGETAIDLVTRLSVEKALIIASQKETGLVIGSDQVATCNNKILTKPHTYERAVEQLTTISGQIVIFQTGLAVVNVKTGAIQSDCIPFSVCFRELSPESIERYLQKEKPYDCAGSFKSEGLGVSLLKKTEGDDASALIGLPLIRLSEMLRTEGLELP